MAIDGELAFYRRELLRVIQEWGVEVSHRNSYFWFDEKDAVLLLDTMTDPKSGLSVGDEVVVHGNLISPWLTGESSDPSWEDSAKFSNRTFRILAFVRVPGRVSGNGGGRRCEIEGTFCALLSREGSRTRGDNQPFVCSGEELGYLPEKVNLYWVGCLEQPEFLKK